MKQQENLPSMWSGVESTKRWQIKRIFSFSNHPTPNTWRVLQICGTRRIFQVGSGCRERETTGCGWQMSCGAHRVKHVSVFILDGTFVRCSSEGHPGRTSASFHARVTRTFKICSTVRSELRSSRDNWDTSGGERTRPPLILTNFVLNVL